MSLLDGCNALEFLGNLVKALFASLLGHTGIHVRPLEVLTTGSSFQVAGCVLDGATLQELEPHLGVLLLVGSGLFEDGSNLHVAVLLGLRCPIAVLVASH